MLTELGKTDSDWALVVSYGFIDVDQHRLGDYLNQCWRIVPKEQISIKNLIKIQCY